LPRLAATALGARSGPGLARWKDLRALQAEGLDRWVLHAERTAAWVRDEGVDSVVEIRLRLYQDLLAAAAAG
jgi:hypothetical protein